MEETGKEFGDEAYIVYVNGENRADTELGQLMHDLNCQKADQMYSGILANRVRELKETRKGVETMCGALEQLYKEGEARGESRGAEKVKRESSVSLYQRGMALEEIAQILRASEKQVRGWLIESEVMKV